MVLFLLFLFFSDGDSKSLDSVQTLTNEGLDSEKSGEKSKEESELHEKKWNKEAVEGNKSDCATAKDLSDLVELKRMDGRLAELREIKANRSSIESLETCSVSGKTKANPLLHKLQDRKLSVSQQTLTNVSSRIIIIANHHLIPYLHPTPRIYTQASYSPALSLSRKAKIRTTNEKESKEKRNRETLLNRPGSDFSLTNPEDMEMDYYDYNVTNASAAPGSYFSISHLMWIPSLLREDFEDEENRIEENVDEDEENEEGEKMARAEATQLNMIGDEGIDPGSNPLTPDSEDNKMAEKKQLTASQYYKNYYDQMDDIQFADDEEDAV